MSAVFSAFVGKNKRKINRLRQGLDVDFDEDEDEWHNGTVTEDPSDGELEYLDDPRVGQKHPLENESGACILYASLVVLLMHC